MGRTYLRPDEVVRGDQTSAGRLAIQKYGGPTTQVEYSTTVITTAQRILQNNARRIGWTVFNRGTTNVDLSYVSTIVSGGGIPVISGSGFVTVSIDLEGESTMSEVWAIAATSSGGALKIIEYLRV